MHDKTVCICINCSAHACPIISYLAASDSFHVFAIPFDHPSCVPNKYFKPACMLSTSMHLSEIRFRTRSGQSHTVSQPTYWQLEYPICQWNKRNIYNSSDIRKVYCSMFPFRIKNFRVRKKPVPVKFNCAPSQVTTISNQNLSCHKEKPPIMIMNSIPAESAWPIVHNYSCHSDGY